MFAGKKVKHWCQVKWKNTTHAGSGSSWTHFWTTSPFIVLCLPLSNCQLFRMQPAQASARSRQESKPTLRKYTAKTHSGLITSFFYFAQLTSVCIPDFTKLFRHPQVARVGLLLTKSVCPPPWHACSATPPRWYGKRGPETNGSPYSHWTDRAMSYGRGGEGVVKPWFVGLFLSISASTLNTCWENSKACGLYRGGGGGLSRLCSLLLFDSWKWQDFVKMLIVKQKLTFWV